MSFLYKEEVKNHMSSKENEISAVQLRLTFQNLARGPIEELESLALEVREGIICDGQVR
jgi:hypothetical protein